MVLHLLLTDIFQLYGERKTFHISLLLMRAINRKMNTLHTRKKAKSKRHNNQPNHRDKPNVCVDILPTHADNNQHRTINDP